MRYEKLLSCLQTTGLYAACPNLLDAFAPLREVFQLSFALNGHLLAAFGQRLS